ncbi:Mobile element protein [Labilithrix luteola]|uniref:Mobile element protein n=1 Tax=Labilithrix luteola TaxID=1391654 RepID=A0A0K1PV33_9BACT|nr:Mobile element protein [Labilithrix luteola]
MGDPNRCGLDAPTCKTIACNESERTCSIASEIDGVYCQATEACSVFATCQKGACVAEPKTCSFTEAPTCQVAKCNPTTGACDSFDPAPDGTPCDADPCTVNATCKGGKCQGGGPRNCRDWSDECNVGKCDAAHAGCYRAPANTGNACAKADACNKGVCDDKGSCVLTAKNEGGVCNDGNSCTTNDLCTSGKCQGSGSGVLLADSFASNANGWTMDAPWAISSPHAASLWCQAFDDHTGFGDSGLASTSLWGDDGTQPRDFAWLTSPAVDASASSTLNLSFYQLFEWLTPPWQQAVMEVWNGTAWVRVWENQDSTFKCVDMITYEQVWKHVTIDLTAYRNSMLRVRFGLAVKVAAAKAGWSIDDLSITSTSCP